MTAKEYLSQAYYIQKMIDAKCEQLEIHRHIATKATSFITARNMSGTDRASKVELHAEQTLMLEEEIKEELERLCKVKSDIAKVIESVEDKQQRTALELYHLNFKKQWEVAKIMHYSRRQIIRILNNAWSDLDERWNTMSPREDL